MGEQKIKQPLPAVLIQCIFQGLKWPALRMKKTLLYIRGRIATSHLPLRSKGECKFYKELLVVAFSNTSYMLLRVRGKEKNVSIFEMRRLTRILRPLFIFVWSV